MEDVVEDCDVWRLSNIDLLSPPRESSWYPKIVLIPNGQKNLAFGGIKCKTKIVVICIVV